MAYWCIDPVDGNNTAAIAAVAGGRHATQAAAEAAPFQTWSLASGGLFSSYTNSPIGSATNFFLGKRGTTATENVNGGVSGHSFRQTYDGGAWGSGDYHIIDGVTLDDQCLSFTGQSGITVKRMRFTRGGASGCLIFVANATRGPDLCIVEDVECDNSQGANAMGLRISDPVAGVFTWSITLNSVNCHDNKNGGIEIVGPVTGATVTDVRCVNNNLNDENNSWGFHAQPTCDHVELDPTPVSGSGVTAIYHGTLPSATDPVAVSLGATIVTTGFYRFTLNNAHYAAGLLPGECARSGTDLRIYPGQTLNVASDVIIAHNVCTGVIVSDSYFSGQHLSADEGDGAGAGFDFFVGNSEFRRCLSEDNGGNGFVFNNCNTGCKALACITIGNGGLGIRTITGAGTYTLTENTSKGNGSGAIGIKDNGTVGPAGANTVLKGNLTLKGGGADTALHVDGSVTGWTEDGNRYDSTFGTVGFVSSTSVADPTSTVGGLPFPISEPGGGTTTGETYDYRGVVRGWRNAGAIEYIPPSPTTRALF